MFDPSEFADSAKSVGSLFLNLSAAMKLNSLIEADQISEAAAFLVSPECPPKIQEALFVKLRENWELFVQSVKGLDLLMRVLGIEQHEAFVRLVQTVRPELLALAERVAARGRGEQKPPAVNIAPSEALTEEEVSRVDKLLSGLNLNLADLLNPGDPGEQGGQ